METKQKYDKTKDYSGKWCLYRTSPGLSIDSIFFIENRDGVVKFVLETAPDVVKYTLESYFESFDMFRVNPFDIEPPAVAKTLRQNENTTTANCEGATSKSSTETVKSYCSGGHCLIGSDDCNFRDCCHFRNGYCTATVYTSYPPKYKICDFCEGDNETFRDCCEVDRSYWDNYIFGHGKRLKGGI